ncbi:hypothetical protein DESPIG_02430 [Desulfovibrio piger ATCC 29098]|uniref:Uncharacterized protein n=1 Tax=Desulfovibrio piger ATCC 29098 TaxID=411464 RepID=B6WWG2_9BACT|nr:hypothetical protein DESPIG_02430 [Desulfovibrio piger ATCC 29098]
MKTISWTQYNHCNDNKQISLSIVTKGGTRPGTRMPGVHDKE